MSTEATLLVRGDVAVIDHITPDPLRPWRAINYAKYVGQEGDVSHAWPDGCDVLMADGYYLFFWHEELRSTGKKGQFNYTIKFVPCRIWD